MSKLPGKRSKPNKITDSKAEPEKPIQNAQKNQKQSVENSNVTTHKTKAKTSNEDSILDNFHSYESIRDLNISNIAGIGSTVFGIGQLTSYLNDNYIHRINKNRIFPNSFDQQLQLSNEINELRKKLSIQAAKIKEATEDNVNVKKEFEILQAELTAKEKISHILPRISEEAKQLLLTSEEFQNHFKDSSKCEAVVVSIDIRRSTELMLKARTPELFSKFITNLSQKLAQVIISNFGIFDKFTGDGILAFFPKFYSGNEAIIRAIKASQLCHLAFREHYYQSRDCFNVFIKDVGLGIGIDFGNVTLVNNQSELTVVGIPVVYACRFSGAKAGETILNQPAKEEVVKICPTMINITETELFVKNEGTALGYLVTLNEAAFTLADPAWKISSNLKQE